MSLSVANNNADSYFIKEVYSGGSYKKKKKGRQDGDGMHIAWLTNIFDTQPHQILLPRCSINIHQYNRQDL